ncbi:MAG: quinone oxidoreductase [Actinomycetia bacterium]|nr:quinone oxidoreductase [Actinomycetes bacterium]
MKAIVVHEFGGPDVLRYEDRPDPVPGPGEALVEIRAIGVNYTDIYSRSGLYRPALPWIPGSEAAGVVAAVGDGVTEVRPGDRVAWASAPGTYAERAVVPAWRLVRLPEDVSFETAAAAMLQGMTAHYLVSSTYPVAAGDRVLVHAGAGGVGLLLTQLAKARGATVFTTVSTEEKARLSREAGADVVIRYTEEDFAARVERETDGEGVAVVYDSVGAATFAGSLACLAPRGYLVLFGQSSGPVPALNPGDFAARSLFFTRPSLVHYTRTRAELLERAQAVLDAIRAGSLKLRLFATLPLAEAAEAHRLLEGRRTTGKLLLTP